MISSHRHWKHVLSERVSDRYARMHAGTLQASDLVRSSFFFDTFGLSDFFLLAGRKDT